MLQESRLAEIIAPRRSVEDADAGSLCGAEKQEVPVDGELGGPQVGDDDGVDAFDGGIEGGHVVVGLGSDEGFEFDGGIEFLGGAAETADGEAFDEGVAREVLADVACDAGDEEEHGGEWYGKDWRIDRSGVEGYVLVCFSKDDAVDID